MTELTYNVDEWYLSTFLSKDSAQNFPKWLIWISAILLIFINLNLNNYYRSVIRDLNKIALNCVITSEHIEPNSIVFPINYTDNWLTGHFCNYLGIDKPIVILENYELDAGYFPLKWNDNFIPNTMLGKLESGKLSCLQWKSNTHR